MAPTGMHTLHDNCIVMVSIHSVGLSQFNKYPLEGKQQGTEKCPAAAHFRLEEKIQSKHPEEEQGYSIHKYITFYNISHEENVTG